MTPNVLKNHRWHLVVLVAVFGICFLYVDRFTPLIGAEDPSPLQTFMRKKLDASSQVLEGLAIEDFSQIKKGANAMLEMSASEMWNVLTDEDYRTFNREFRSSIRKLNEAADKKNIDNALLQWMDATKSCVECHKYVRHQRAVLKK